MVANLDLLLAAIRQGRSMTVLARTTAGARETQMRLIPGAQHDEGFWAEMERGEVDLIDRLIAAEAMVQATICVGEANVMFQSALMQRRKRLGGKQQVQFYWPVRLQVIERRQREREPVPEAMPLTARMVSGETEDESGGFPVRVCELSENGGSFLCTAAVHLAPGEIIRIGLCVATCEHWFTGRHRRTEMIPGVGARFGVEFLRDDPRPEAELWLREFVEELRTRRIRRGLKTTLDKPPAR